MSTPTPSLTLGQQTQALTAFSQNSAVQGLVAGRSYTTAVVPWTTYSAQGSLGAGIDVTFTTPVTVSNTTWPEMVYDETETLDPPYLSTTHTVSATNVTGVHVDMKQTVTVRGAIWEVVGMDVLPGADVSRDDIDPSFQDTRPPQPDLSSD